MVVKISNTLTIVNSEPEEDKGSFGLSFRPAPTRQHRNLAVEGTARTSLEKE